MSMIIRLLAVSFSFFALANYLIFNWKVSNVDQNPLGLNNRCYVPDWNRVNTESIKGIFWNNISRWLWMRLKLSNENLHNNTETSIFAAYLYHNKISITITSQHLVQQKVYCRYYDCERKEIPGSSWHGMVFPESVVDCPRRYGAEFVSVSKSLEEQAPAPVKLIYRLYKEPVHELAVCLSPMYGKQPSWLSIVDFVEHHKLEGVTQFYFYVGEISDHDEKILNDYVRTGEMEVIKMQDKYKRVFMAWQFLEIQDCLLRSRYHSKWTAFIDLDERISTNGQRMVDLLQSIHDPGIGEILIQVMSIVKDKDYPAVYKNSKELENELIFKKYNQSLTPTWKGKKAIVRSDKIGIMSVHYAIAKYPGIKTLLANSTLAVLRHLRSTKHRINGSAWHLTPNENGTLPIFRDVPLPPTFSKTLREAIIKRVQFVYETIPVNCSTIPSQLADMINHPDPCSKPWPNF